MLEVRGTPGPSFLELNTERCSQLPSRVEGEPIALLRRPRFSAAAHDMLYIADPTEIVTTNLDRAVDALRAAAGCSGTVASFLDGPVDRKEEYQHPIVPPAELLAGAESFSLSDGHCSHGTAHVLGGPGNYRIEVVYDGPSHQVWRTFTPECNTLRSYYHG